MSTTLIPNVSSAEGVVIHWLRHVFESSPAGWPDSIRSAGADAIWDDMQRDEINLEWCAAFGVGAEFGARVALAVAAAPLGGSEDSISNAASEALAHLALYDKDKKADEELERRQSA